MSKVKNNFKSPNQEITCIHGKLPGPIYVGPGEDSPYLPKIGDSEGNLFIQAVDTSNGYHPIDSEVTALDDPEYFISKEKDSRAFIWTISADKKPAKLNLNGQTDVNVEIGPK
jgi:hypothetical protein